MNRRDFFLKSTAAGTVAGGWPRAGLPYPGGEDATKPTTALEVPALGLRLRLRFSVDAPVKEWRPVQQHFDSSTFAGGPFRLTVRPKPLAADVVTVEVEIQREDGENFEINSARVTLAIPM